MILVFLFHRRDRFPPAGTHFFLPASGRLRPQAHILYENLECIRAAAWLNALDLEAGEAGRSCHLPGYHWDPEGDILDAPFCLKESTVPRYACDLPVVPYVAPAKIGRNDPCPCGSGKQYKKCRLNQV